MIIRHRILSWILENNRELFKKIKGIQDLDIGADSRFLDMHAKMVKMLPEDQAIQNLRERYNIYHFMKATSRLEGAVGEVGVYRGGSAYFLCQSKGDAPLYLFDTFEGLPSFAHGTEGVFTTGDFSNTSVAAVKEFLKDFDNVHFYKGFFPDSALNTPAEDLRFRFVHLDVDIEESTYKSLEFFYPRMVSSGIIISHDYKRLSAPGVKRAYDAFFKDKPETVVPIWDTQCLVVKI